MEIFEIFDLVVKSILTIIGLYLVHSYRRQIALRVAERRLNAYAAIWSKMGVATPVRITPWNALPLTATERKKLFNAFTEWYYESGNGMLLAGGTRAIYLAAKDNLVCPVEYYQPKLTQKKLLNLQPEEQEAERGRLSIRQLSLLRSRMKADLRIYGVTYHIDLNDDDKAFLTECGEKLSSKPWARGNTIWRANFALKIFLLK